MNCQELVELVTDYLDETLAPPARARFEEYLIECEYCAIYLDQMRQTLEIAGRIQPEQLAPTVRDDLLTAFRTWSERRSG